MIINEFAAYGVMFGLGLIICFVISVWIQLRREEPEIEAFLRRFRKPNDDHTTLSALSPLKLRRSRKLNDDHTAPPHTT